MPARRRLSMLPLPLRPRTPRPSSCERGCTRATNPAAARCARTCAALPRRRTGGGPTRRLPTSPLRTSLYGRALSRRPSPCCVAWSARDRRTRTPLPCWAGCTPGGRSREPRRPAVPPFPRRRPSSRTAPRASRATNGSPLDSPGPSRLPGMPRPRARPLPLLSERCRAASRCACARQSWKRVPSEGCEPWRSTSLRWERTRWPRCSPSRRVHGTAPGSCRSSWSRAVSRSATLQTGHGGRCRAASPSHPRCAGTWRRSTEPGRWTRTVTVSGKSGGRSLPAARSPGNAMSTRTGWRSLPRASRPGFPSPLHLNPQRGARPHSASAATPRFTR